MKKGIVFVFFFLCVSLFIFADSEDLFLNELLDMAGLDLALETESVSDESDVLISEISIQIEGSTREAWVRSKLIIKEGKKYDKTELQNLIKIQKSYFDETNLFYTVEIYILPREDSSYVLYVKLIDGFMQLYNFDPWDLMWGIRHLEKGDELLEVVAGYNTQSINYDRPNIFDSSLSYSIGVKHYYGKSDGLETNYFDFSSRIYYSYKIWFNTGFDVSYRNYNVGSVSTGQYGKVGLFFDLFPKYPVLKPVGMNLKVSGGKLFNKLSNKSWYFDSCLKVIVKPETHFSFEIQSDFSFVTNNDIYFIKPSAASFRSPEKLNKGNYYLRSYVQFNYEDLFKWHIYFTDLTLSPMVYYEMASAADDVKQICNEIHHALGSGITLAFKSPVCLYFTFGVMMNINNPLKCGFLFSVKTSFY